MLEGSKESVAKKLLVFITALTLTGITGVLPARADEGGEPVDVEKLFERAMKDRKENRLYSAIELFQGILNNQPSLHRARLELAVAYYKVMQFEDAEKNAQIVLDDPNTPQNVKLAIMAFLAQVRKDKESMSGRSDWRFPVSAGLIYDSNVNAGPDSTVIPENSLLTLTPGSLEQSDWGKVISIGLNNTYYKGRPVRLGQVMSNFVWLSGVSIYHRGYFDKDDFDLDVLSLRTGPGLLAGNRVWRTNLILQEDLIEFGNDQLGSYFSIMPSFTLHTKIGLEFNLDATVSWRNYTRDEDAVRGRDSEYISPQFSIAYVFADGRAIVQAGVSYFDENAEKPISENDGTEWYASGSWRTFEDKLTFYGRVNQRSIEFEGIETGFVLNRDEDQFGLMSGVRYTFLQRNTTEWSLHAKVNYYDNDSNISIYDYDRTQYSFTVDVIF